MNAHATEPQHVLFDRFELDERDARLYCDGKVVDLPPRPFALLCALARQPGSLLTKNALLDEVWGHRFVCESVLKSAIGKVRIALQDDARNPRFIETVSRRGYRFVATTRVADGVRRPGPATESAVAETSLENALRQIGELIERSTGRKPLMLLIEHPHGIDGAAALVDHLAHRGPGTATERAIPAN